MKNISFELVNQETSMITTKSGVTRRHFIKTTMAAVGTAALPSAGAAALTFGGAAAQGKARYTRYNVKITGGGDKH
jgi:hypothetical protein